MVTDKKLSFKRLSVIIPTYNEELYIGQVLKKVLSQKEVWEVIVVDDGSKDQTPKILNKIKNSKLKVIIHNQNQGKGSAIRTGFQNFTGDFVIIQDADLEYNPSEYKKLLKRAGTNSVVYGSRITGKCPHAYARTYLGNVFISSFASFIFGLKLTDTYTCYKLLPSAIAKKLQIKSNGFELEAEITAKLAKAKITIYEVPISYKPRSYEQGKKIKAKDGLLGFWTFLKIKLSREVEI